MKFRVGCDEMISEDRLKHILSVARECERIAKEAGHTDDFCEACFVMGFLHDIGYAGNNSMEHGVVGYEMIKSFIKYKEALEAIKTHGKKFSDLTEFDRILNLADMQVDAKGNIVNCLDRLEDIESRYGKDSIPYKNSVKVLQALGKIES